MNITFTPDKELNILMYRSPSYLIIYRSHTLLKMVRFFGPPCILWLNLQRTVDKGGQTGKKGVK